MFVLSCWMWTVGLPVLSSAAQQRLSESEDTKSDKTDKRGRDIMLVIAGGEGYVDYRRGTQLVSFTDSVVVFCASLYMLVLI